MPAPGATVAGLDFLLQWRPGRGGVEHDLHVSNDLNALLDGSSFAARLQESQFDSAGLELLHGETVYWKVDEINELTLPAQVEGDIWRFSILDYLVVDDMESYRDEEFLEIWATWLDGFEDPANGALVGNGAAGTPETGIVHGGRQSMPVFYDNSGIGGAAMVSEVERTWSAPQDWQRGMPDTLTLNVYGDPNNGADTLYVALEDKRGTSSKRVVSHPDPTVLQAAGWQVWDIPLSDFGSVNLANITKLYVGVGNPESPRFGGSGVFFLDDVRVGKSGP